MFVTSRSSAIGGILSQSLRRIAVPLRLCGYLFSTHRWASILAAFLLVVCAAAFLNASNSAAVVLRQRPIARSGPVRTLLKAASQEKPTAQATAPAAAPAPKLEGCVSCHGKIEPMHKYSATDTLINSKTAKDAVGLSCTTCHGGNPAPGKTVTIRRRSSEPSAPPARSRFPDEWKRDE